MRAVGVIVRKAAAVIGRGCGDPVRIRAGRDERQTAAHAVTRDTDAAGPHVRLCREKVEEDARVGHDVGRGCNREVLLHEDLAHVRIREYGVRVHGLIRARAVEKIRQQHEIAMAPQPLAELQHGRADAEAVHEDEYGGPGAGAGGSIDVAGTDAVASLDFYLAHRACLSHAGPRVRAMRPSSRLGSAPPVACSSLEGANHSATWTRSAKMETGPRSRLYAGFPTHW